MSIIPDYKREFYQRLLAANPYDLEPLKHVIRFETTNNLHDMFSWVTAARPNVGGWYIDFTCMVHDHGLDIVNKAQVDIHEADTQALVMEVLDAFVDKYNRFFDSQSQLPKDIKERFNVKFQNIKDQIEEMSGYSMNSPRIGR